MADETAKELAYAAARRETVKAEEELAEARAIVTEQLRIGKKPTDEMRQAVLEARIETDKYTKAQEDLADALNLAKDQGESMATALGRAAGMTQDFERTVAGATIAILSSEDAMNSFTEKLGKMFTVQKGGLAILNTFKDSTLALAYAQDEALASFNKNTGAARLYEQQIMALERTTFQHGVGVGESAEAYASLVNNVTDLRNMSRGTQDELSKTTAILSHMGVSMDTTAANVQFMTRSLGTGVGEATKYQRELAVLAQEIGMPPEQMAAGFKAAQPKLAAFGKQAGKVFKTLAVNARAAGMEVEQMLSIVEQFDTFEGAAESVGKLNALLGGPFLNSMEMVMTTDPTERMRMLSGALNDAGKSFDQMTYYEKKSIAAAAGLSDVNELALVMAGSFDETAGGANRSQAEIEALAKQSKEFNTMMEELSQTMMMFALEMRPVIEGAKSFLQFLQGQMPVLKALTPIILGMAAAMVAWKTGITLATLEMWKLNIASAAGPIGKALLFAAAVLFLGKALESYFGPAIWGVVGALLAMTAAWLALSVASAGLPVIIGLIVTGIAALIQMFATQTFWKDCGKSLAPLRISGQQ